MTAYDRAKKLLEGVTPGPWAWRKGFWTKTWRLSPGILLAYQTDGTPGGDSIDRANADFIAAARDLVPELLAEIEALREKLAEYQDDYGDLPNPAYLRGRQDGWDAREIFKDDEWSMTDGVLTRHKAASGSAVENEASESDYTKSFRETLERFAGLSNASKADYYRAAAKAERMAELEKLIREAPPMTPEQFAAQRESWAVAEAGFGSDAQEAEYREACLAGDVEEIERLEKDARKRMELAKRVGDRIASPNDLLKGLLKDQ